MGLDVIDVSKSYPTPTGKLWAIRDINLNIADGEFITLVGASGSGKTTLLNVIDGLTLRDSGRIVLDGQDISGVSQSMAMVFQDIALLPWRSVVENVEIGFESRQRRLSRQKRRQLALESLEMVGLRGLADSAPYKLSGGMQQRVGVARALVTRPKVLLLDEPFGQLDNFTRERLQGELEQLWLELKMIVLFVTHDVSEAVRLGDRVALFRRGGLVAIHEVPLERPRASRKVLHDPAATRLTEAIIDDLGVQEALDAEAQSGSR